MASRRDAPSSTSPSNQVETLARELAERDGIQDGLVCIYSVLEPCRTYSLRWNQPDHIQPAKRKCLFLYYYFMDRERGSSTLSCKPGSPCHSRFTSTP